MSGFNMQCAKVQRLLDDLSENRLSEALSREVRRHLDECTDCRVAHQRAARLQQLLTLKRHERPSPEYFDRFLSAFHQRLEAETRTQTGWWEQFVASIAVRPPRVWRYALAGGVGSCLIAGVLMSQRILPSWQTAAVTEPQPAPLVVGPTFHEILPASFQVLDYNYLRSAEPTPAGGTALIPPATHDGPSTPRYVLDRITVTPVNYEVASSIRF